MCVHGCMGAWVRACVCVLACVSTCLYKVEGDARDRQILGKKVGDRKRTPKRLAQGEKKPNGC